MRLKSTYKKISNQDRSRMSIFNENVSNVYLNNQMMRLMSFDFHGHLIAIRVFSKKNCSLDLLFRKKLFAPAALSINDSRINFGQVIQLGMFITFC